MQSSIVHIEEAARQLAQLAEREGFAFLAYLLGMAAQEAEEINARGYVPIPRGDQFEDCCPCI